MKTKIFTLSGLLLAAMGFGQQNYWSKASKVPTENLKPRMTHPNEFAVYQLNLDKIKSDLATAPQRASGDKSHVVTFPDADGKFRNYVVQEASVMAPELQAKYPQLRSYIGWDKNNAANSIRFSVTPEGLSAMYFDGWKVSYLDALTSDNSQYILYKRSDLPVNDRIFECRLEGELDEQETNPTAEAPLVSDGLFRTYRLALAATGEYTTYHGGTVAKAMTAIVNAMTRVNGVYEKTISITMVLIPNNDLIIYTNAATDPYTNDDGFAMLGENQTNINNVIGVANYDVGHVFSTGGGGVAQLGSICTSGKARGVTGLPSPIGDPFYIDYVAHEMGHQFGGNHTFHATTGSCGGGNRNLSTAFEPGSGSTIMAYAGICGSANNVQNNSDPYFHSVSVNEMYTVIRRASDCSVKTPNNNGVPTADAGLDYIIPKGTAYVLTGVGTDPDNDPITYLWEQMDNQNSAQPPVSTAVGGPAYRSLIPMVSPSRYMPAMNFIMANNLAAKWEMTPTVARTLNFSLLVNDNKATGNQSARDMMKVTVTADGPFKATSHTTNVEYTGGEPTTVTWDVAGTNAGTINTQNVSILLTSNNGAAWTTIAAGVPNNGSASVVLPNENIAAARLMIKADNNIYFAVNSSNFSIKKNLATVESNTKNMAIYPNPAKHEINVVLKNKGAATYSIFDTTGRMVSGGTLNEDGKVNVERLINGNYILNITMKNGEKFTEKVMIKK